MKIFQINNKNRIVIGTCEGLKAAARLARFLPYKLRNFLGPKKISKDEISSTSWQHSDRAVHKVAQSVKGKAVGLALKAPLGLRNFDPAGYMSPLLRQKQVQTFHRSARRGLHFDWINARALFEDEVDFCLR